MYTIQQILNKVRVDENGEALKTSETEQQAFNAVFDPEKNALRVSGPDATISNKGFVELATDDEAIAGTDTERAVTPANVTAKMDMDGTLAGNQDTRIPSQKAVKTYADTKASKDSFKPPVPVAFAGSSGRTITHNYGHTDYQLIINPIADPGGYLGEIWISKAANTAVVYNSGSATGNFDYVILPSS